MTAIESDPEPDDLIGRRFTIAMRGYDRGEVDSFLVLAAAAWRTSLASTSAGLTAGQANGTGPTEVRDGGSDASAHAARGPALPAEPRDAATDGLAAPMAGGADASGPAVGPPERPDEPSRAATADAIEIEAVAAPDPVLAEETIASPSRRRDHRAKVERDRATAFAERKAAERDRAQARTELARAQEEALGVVDQAQRRAEAVLIGVRGRAVAEAEAVVAGARSRLGPLLEQERAVRARLARLRRDLDALTGDGPDPEVATLTEPETLVNRIEDDPDTPVSSFPVGFTSVNL